MGNKVWTKEDIKKLLMTNDKFLLRGLLAIYSLQTEDEKSANTTKYCNSVGFNSIDSNFLCGLAEQLKTKRFLTPKQISFVRKLLPKYSKQMLKIANGEIEVNESDLIY
jgi:hypothetical protein